MTDRLLRQLPEDFYERFPEPKLIRGLSGIAKTLKVGQRRAWELTSSNSIPCYRIGRLLVCFEHELHAWLLAGAPEEPGSGELIKDALYGKRRAKR